MAFGSAAKNTGSKSKSAEFKPTENIFFNTKRGQRLFRIFPQYDEVRIKQVWVARDPDGTWVPKFGYNPNDKREVKPVTVAVFDAANDTWVGNAWQNPLMQWVEDNIDDEEARKGMYAKELFYLNVLDRTMVKLNGEEIVFPDPKNQFPDSLKGTAAQMVNKTRILQGSSGKVRDENGDIVGKHMYANLLRVVESGEVDPNTGMLLTPDKYDIRLVTTGSDKETDRKFSITANRDDINFSQYQVYDLINWLKPMPEDAMDDLLAGAAWDDVIKNYNVKQFPDAIPFGGVAEDDIPF